MMDSYCGLDNGVRFRIGGRGGAVGDFRVAGIRNHRTRLPDFVVPVRRGRIYMLQEIKK